MSEPEESVPNTTKWKEVLQPVLDQLNPYDMLTPIPSGEPKSEIEAILFALTKRNNLDSVYAGSFIAAAESIQALIDKAVVTELERVSANCDSDCYTAGVGTAAIPMTDFINKRIAELEGKP